MSSDELLYEEFIQSMTLEDIKAWMGYNEEPPQDCVSYETVSLTGDNYDDEDRLPF